MDNIERMQPTSETGAGDVGFGYEAKDLGDEDLPILAPTYCLVRVFKKAKEGNEEARWLLGSGMTAKKTGESRSRGIREQHLVCLGCEQEMYIVDGELAGQDKCPKQLDNT